LSFSQIEEKVLPRVVDDEPGEVDDENKDELPEAKKVGDDSEAEVSRG